MKRAIRKAVSIMCAAGLALGLMIPGPAAADTVNTSSAGSYPQRIFGTTLYDTAAAISQTGWTTSDYAVLATGSRFQDALAGTVLAHKLNAPLLLTQSDQLTPQILTELKRLNTRTVYILGGKVAVTPNVESALTAQGIAVERIAGYDQYGTAAQIAQKVTSSSAQAFLVTGERYPDALSVSSYAAAQGIPLLMTTRDKLPQDTIDALTALGVKEVTVVGGTAAISDTVVSQLASLPSPVKVTERLAGYDQYETNTIVLNSLSFNTDTVFIATGENFPDALAGAALAAQNNQPIVLVPRTTLASYTAAYLNARRNAGSEFTIFGGWGVIDNHMESIIRTGSPNPRVSLQYVQGSSFQGQLSEIAVLPASNATNYADIIAPDWMFMEDTQGTVTGEWDGTNNYQQMVATIHARSLKALPVIQSTWSSTQPMDGMLASPTARANVISQLLQRVQSSGADGVVIDFEYMSGSSAANLTQFMKELYAKFHPLGKLVVQAVGARTGDASWAAFNYSQLYKYSDYMDIMTYDYSKSLPGPCAPLDWIKSVLNYTRSQGVDMKKVLLGIPYYGRDWTSTGASSYGTPQSRGLYSLNGIDGAMDRLTMYNTSLKRDASQIPYYTYTDSSSAAHTVYFDDPTSWDAKLALVQTYNLGGIGAWSLYWVSDQTAQVLFPLLQQHLR